MKNKFFMLIAMLTALCYNAWLLAFWLNPQLVSSTLLSGLEALNQPYHQLFIAADILAGLLAMLLAWGLYHQIADKKEAPVFIGLCGALAAFGLTNSLAASFPYPTSKIQSGIPNPLTEPLIFLHDGLSVVVILCMLLSVFLSLYIYRNVLFLIIAVIFLMTSLYSFLAGLAPEIFGPIGQQINTLLTGLWLILISWRVLYDTE